MTSLKSSVRFGFLLLLSLVPFLSPSPISAAETSSFLYSASGQRIAKLEDSGNHTYYFPGVEVIIDGNDNISFRRYYALNGATAVRDNHGVSYTHADQLGNTAITTDSNGALIGSTSYFPYGKAKGVSGTISGERLYTGQISDENATGLYYYNARYYSPTLGRFTQADTVSSGQNKYAYVSNNPINLTDPTGHCESWDYWCIMEENDGVADVPEYNPNPNYAHRGDRGNYGHTPQLQMCLVPPEPALSYEEVVNYYNSTAYFNEVQKQAGTVALALNIAYGAILAAPFLSQYATAIEMLDTTLDVAACRSGGNPLDCAFVLNPIPGARYFDDAGSSIKKLLTRGRDMDYFSEGRHVQEYVGELMEGAARNLEGTPHTRLDLLTEMNYILSQTLPYDEQLVQAIRSHNRNGAQISLDYFASCRRGVCAQNAQFLIAAARRLNLNPRYIAATFGDEGHAIVGMTSRNWDRYWDPSHGFTTTSFEAMERMLNSIGLNPTKYEDYIFPLSIP